MGRGTYQYIKDFLTERTTEICAGDLQLEKKKLDSVGTQQGSRGVRLASFVTFVESAPALFLPSPRRTRGNAKLSEGQAFFSGCLTTAKLDDAAHKQQGRRRKKILSSEPLATGFSDPPLPSGARDARSSTNASRAPGFDDKEGPRFNHAATESPRLQRHGHRHEGTELAGDDGRRRSSCSLTSTTPPESPVRPPRKQSCPGEKKRRRRQSSRRGSVRRSQRRPKSASDARGDEPEPTAGARKSVASVQQVSRTLQLPQELRSQPPCCSHAVSAGLPVPEAALPHSELNRENEEATAPTAPRCKKSSRRTRRSSSRQQKTAEVGTTSLTGDAGTPVAQEPPATQSKGSGSRHWKDIPEGENERRCQRTLSLRRPVDAFLSASLSTSGTGSGSNESAGHRRRLSLRYPAGAVSCALRLVTDVAAMLACEHRLRPRPFLGVLPRNCTSYSRDKACSAILDDANPGSRPASVPAPGRCRAIRPHLSQ
ncbi:uncharacterized protein [Dermacentor andersoni]|uniref:uncharacterized protein n=1 Tax=Dermacentor andersoni TaxID=34620 RepID=UPI002416BFF4|nr:uncharacterized protein LOC129384182 [Dermacentor andersoni]